MSTLVVGLGNPYLGDDGVGWKIVAEARALWEKRLSGGEVEFRQASLGGISLMEMLIGYDKAVIVDAMQSQEGVQGKLRRLSVDALPSRHSTAAHEASLKDALELGKRLGASLPEQIVLIGVETAFSPAISEQLSPEVEASILPAAQLILEELD